MNILIAPDSFKGSLSAVEFCEIADRVLQKHSNRIETCLMPLADGGEGTLEAVQTILKGRKYSVNVHNALGISTFAQYLLMDPEQDDETPFDKPTALIEMAQACGLPDIHPRQRNPLKTSSFGLGELIKHALDRGARQLIIGLGGSATNDAGMGMLAALGVQFYTDDGRRMLPAGQMLGLIERIDISRMDPRLKDCKITIASDVTNPLLGEHGATRVFAPQKGADEEMVEALETGMSSFAAKTLHTLDLPEQLIETPGAGAAGGLGFALLAYLNADIQSGFELLSQWSGLDKLLDNPASRPGLIITGEGQFDEQSLKGKLTGQIIRKAGKHNIPLKIICGQYQEGIETQLEGQAQLIALKDQSLSVTQSMADSRNLLEQKLAELFSDYTFFNEKAFKEA